MIVVIRKNIFILLIFLIILMLAFCLNRFAIMQVLKITNASKVVIDPGHGGIDGGAVAKDGTLESHINLDISFKLKQLFEDNEWDVVMTREEDAGLYSNEGTIRSKKMQDLINRKQIIERENPDFVIIIHLNSFPDDACFGAQTFYPSKSEDSEVLAKEIQSMFLQKINDGNRREIKEKSDILLLKNTKVPTVLIECGFLSNPREAELLKQESYQYLIAQCIYDGLLRYCEVTNNPPRKGIKYIVNRE